MSQTSAPPIDEKLGKEVAGFAAYFSEQTASSYDNGIAKPLIENPHWQQPMDAIKDAFANPWEKSPGWHHIKPEAFRGQIEKWLKQNHVTAFAPLAHGYNGWTAAVFLAKIEGADTPQIVRIGNESGNMPHLNIPWNPLLLEPHSIGYMRHEGPVQRLVLSRGSIAPMVEPGKPQGFDQFMNDYILQDTPYRVKENKDWSLLPDGTPLSGDPADGLVFKDMATARVHAGDRSNPAAQQKIMRTIYDNAMRLEKGLQAVYGPDYHLPQSMNFVVKRSGGGFATKQSLMLSDPLQHSQHANGHDVTPRESGRSHNKIVFPDSDQPHSLPVAKPPVHPISP